MVTAEAGFVGFLWIYLEQRLGSEAALIGMGICACMILWLHRKDIGTLIKRITGDGLSEGTEPPVAVASADFGSPFLTLHFPIKDLMSTEIRTDYIFIKNIGQRAALDVQVADISKEWGGSVYVAKFPLLQLLQGNDEKPITPTVYRNGDYHPIFSINSRIWFCALLIGEQNEAKIGAEIIHNVSVSYTDQGVKRSNSMVVVAKWTGSDVLVSVRNQT